jgi:hypothetical protein
VIKASRVMTIGDWINLILAVATVLMAAGTLYLAIETRRLARDTAEGIKQADRHHQEDLRPFCVIDFFDASQQYPFGTQFDPEDRRRIALVSGIDRTPSANISIRGDLRNKGNGPTQEVLVYLNVRRGSGEDGAFRMTRPVLVSGLVGPAETIAIDVSITESDVVRTLVGGESRSVQAFHAVAGETYEIVFEYKDVFGNIFRTVHARGIWTPVQETIDPAKRTEMTVRPDRPAPAFLTGRQALRTLADVPRPHISMALPLDDRAGAPNE